LKIKRQIRCLQKRLFNFHLGLIVVVQLENNVGESFEIRIDRAIECELDVARIEAALLRMVVADLNVVEIAKSPSKEMFM
jgi:hypothetical protein